jgi:UPF0755 protein
MIRSSNKRFWLKTVLFAGLVFCLATLIGTFVPRNKNSTQETVFSIKKGEGSREIEYNLQMQGLIRSGPFLRFYVLTIGVSHKLQAGDYLLSPSMSLSGIVRKFTLGDIIRQEFTIIEGWDIEDIKNYFAKKGRSIEISPDLEGYLFPDTYHVGSNASNEEIIAMMRENFEKKFSNDLLQETMRQGKTIAQIVTMASLLERELQTLQDKKIAAGILFKRIQYGIPLQVDAEPTTYTYRGLPASPIANPGLESILAALYPEESSYLYYLSTPEGETIFSKTLKEHGVAKARYLK